MRQQAIRDNHSDHSPAGASVGKYLTFFLADEEYGIDILKVHEIIGMMAITPVPTMPNYVKGVINLRGKVIPVIDLRLKLGMASVEYGPRTCIIVVQANGVVSGVIVDRVSEAVDISETDIEDASSFGAAVNSNYIFGIGKCEGRVNLLLNIDNALASQDADDTEAVSADAGKPAATTDSLKEAA